MPSSTSDTRTSQHRVLHHRDDPNKKVTAYLNSFFTESQIKDQRSKEGVWTRKICCGTSRSLYCPICCSLLVPEDCKKPAPVQLPFDLDIILTDRRGSSSGLHAVTLTEPGSVNLVDYEGGDAMPRYNNHADEDAVGRQSFLLYPLEGESCALSDVAPCIAKLVVLDCKWTKSSIKEHPELHKLQKVFHTTFVYEYVPCYMIYFSIFRRCYQFTCSLFPFNVILIGSFDQPTIGKVCSNAMN